MVTPYPLVGSVTEYNKLGNYICTPSRGTKLSHPILKILQACVVWLYISMEFVLKCNNE